jgi:hypothetical protein
MDVLDLFRAIGYPLAMSDANDKLTPVDPADLADAIAFALRYSGRKRVHHGDEYMAKIAAERIVRHLEDARFVVMRRPPIGGSAPTRP